jgi:predicted DNA-binding transcriptional regulator AlpA
MEVLTSYNRIELEQIILESVQKAINYKPTIPPQEPSDEMDFKEFLKLTGYQAPTGYKKVSEGLVPAYRRGKNLVFSRREILQWLQAKTVRRVSPALRMEAHLSDSVKSKV